MMVPVGRLTLVRTFPKSELIRAMSFVAIPGLVGPMLGPIVGGLVVAYLHWRVIFFINLVPSACSGFTSGFGVTCPIIARASPRPLDVIGLLLFGLGIGLLAYVLELFGEHTLGAPILVGLSRRLRHLPYRLYYPGRAHINFLCCDSICFVSAPSAPPSSAVFSRALALAESPFSFPCSIRSVSG